MDNLKFLDLNLSDNLQRAITDMGFEEATPIQSKAIPEVMTGKDVIGQAQTGTGKTCAFGIPIVEMLDADDSSIQALVVCPTRELALQTADEIKSLLKYTHGLKTLSIYGGQQIDRQIMALKKRPQIIIGTPGRIMDHLRRKTLKLQNLKMIVLDEADEMLNMGFREDIDTILEKVPEDRQTVLFSATMPPEIIAITKKYLKDPVHIRIAKKELTVPSIEQYYIECRESNKLEILSRFMDTSDAKLSIVFTNTKKKADELCSALQSRGYQADALHGDIKQEARDRVMKKFRRGHIDVLIATDVAARGIDVDNIDCVYNYDVPSDEEYYIHRIGRTGRAGRSGKSYTFVVGKEIYKIKDIQQYTKSHIKPIKPPTLSDVQENKVTGIIEGLKQTLKNNDISKYSTYIDTILTELNTYDKSQEGITSFDLAAMLLKKLLTVGTEDVNDFLESTSLDKMAKTRLFINLGKKDKMGKKDFIDFLDNNTSIPTKKIGEIDIHDSFSFIEVPTEFSREIITSLNTKRVRGRRVNVEPTHTPKALPKGHKRSSSDLNTKSKKFTEKRNSHSKKSKNKKKHSGTRNGIR